MNFPSEEKTREARASLDELIKACEKTTLRLQTSEETNSFNVRLSVSDLPPMDQVMGPAVHLAQMVHEGKASMAQARVQARAATSIPPALQAPVIDGNPEDAWAGVPSHAIEHVTYAPASSEADLSARFKAMYDKEALYILVDVTDDQLRSDSAEFWLDDGVEVFIDADNSKSDVYGENDYQYHFDWDSSSPAVGETHHSKTAGVQYAFARTDDGYRLEAKFPWSMLGAVPNAGTRIGLDVHVNDDDDGGDRDTKRMWHAERDVAWQNPQAFGTGELAGLIGWWKLDETEGTTASDSSGNGHDATLHGDPKWQPSGGKVGGALQFDGDDDYADTGYDDSLSTWTVAAWVKSPAAPTSAGPSGPVHREKNFQINWNHELDQFRGAAGVSLGVKWHAASFGSLQADTWYHLAATFDGKSLKAYTNGTLVTNNPDASGVPDIEPETLKLGRHARDNNCFAGTIDDVRLYNFGLDEAQIQQLFREGK